jgi:hypothetical protein
MYAFSLEQISCDCEKLMVWMCLAMITGSAVSQHPEWMSSDLAISALSARRSLMKVLNVHVWIGSKLGCNMAVINCSPKKVLHRL